MTRHLTDADHGGTQVGIQTVTIPGPPKGKGRPRFSAHGTYTPAETKAAEEEIGWLARTNGFVMLDGPLVVVVNAYYPIPASWSKKKRLQAERHELYPVVKPDLDNVVKLILDSLNNIAWHDDAQVISIMAEKQYSTDPKVVVSVGESFP